MIQETKKRRSSSLLLVLVVSKTNVPLSLANSLKQTATTATMSAATMTMRKTVTTNDDFRFDSDDAVFRDFFLGAILYLPFLTFFGGVTIEVDVLGTFDGLASNGDRLIVFAMLLILCCVVLFLEISR